MNESGMGVQQQRQRFYSSTQGPFQPASGILMFYAGGHRGEILANIERLIDTDEGEIVVQGEPGSGKTLMSLVLAERLRHRCNIIRYEHPRLSAAALLRHLLIELCPAQAGLLSAGQADIGAADEVLEVALQRVGEALQQCPPADKPFVLIIDSGADMSVCAQRVLHRLMALHTLVGRVLQVVHFKRLEAEVPRTASPFEAPHTYQLRRLTRVEVDDYLQHQMMLHAYNRREQFTPEMSCFVSERSNGVFRAINTLARRAYELAERERADRLDLSHLIMADAPGHARDVMSTGFLACHGPRVIALTAACVVGLTLVAFSIYI